MLLHLITISLWVLTIGYSIVIAGYHINKATKKPRRKGPGNYRMPKEVLLALTELINRRAHFHNLVNSATEEDYKIASEEINSNRIDQQFNLGNRKQKQFPLFKTRNNSFMGYSKLYATSRAFTKNDNMDSVQLFKANIHHLALLKNSETLTQNPKNRLACLR